jgi:hypothetical protein
VRRLSAHGLNRSKEDDDRREVLAYERLLAVSQPCGAGAGAERLTVAAADADVILDALRLVRNFVKVRFVTPHAHALFLKPRRRVGELLRALYLNHLFRSSL